MSCPPLTSFLQKRPSLTFGSAAARASSTPARRGSGQAGQRAGDAPPSGDSYETYDSYGLPAPQGAGPATAEPARQASVAAARNPDPNGAQRFERSGAQGNGAHASGQADYPTRRTASYAAQPGRAAASHVRSASRGAAGVLDFLRIDDKMAALLPAATRMAALQTDCAALLPEMFKHCAVLQFAQEQLVLAVPNAAIAARLRQRLPNLQEALVQRGWQVNAIRLKVQVGANVPKTVYVKQAVMPALALVAMADLESTLEDEPRNAPLKAALARLLKHQRD